MEQRVRFHLSLSAEDVLRYYEGSARQVQVTATDGRRVRFPVEHLRPFVTPTGVRGEFLLTFDGQQRFRSLQRLSSG